MGEIIGIVIGGIFGLCIVIYLVITIKDWCQKHDSCHSNRVVALNSEQKKSGAGSSETSSESGISMISMSST